MSKQKKKAVEVELNLTDKQWDEITLQIQELACIHHSFFVKSVQSIVLKNALIDPGIYYKQEKNTWHIKSKLSARAIRSVLQMAYLDLLHDYGEIWRIGQGQDIIEWSHRAYQFYNKRFAPKKHCLVIQEEDSTLSNIINNHRFALPKAKSKKWLKFIPTEEFYENITRVCKIKTIIVFQRKIKGKRKPVYFASIEYKDYGNTLKRKGNKI